jgi:hypothetical protein
MESYIALMIGSCKPSALVKFEWTSRVSAATSSFAM